MSPRISIITSTYNRADIIHRAIDSVCAQTMPDWEMCIVGDCTPDQTQTVVASYNDERIRFYNLPEKSPAGAHGAIAKNYAMERMTQAPMIAYLDDDDAYKPRYLERMLNHLAKHPDAGVVYCRSEYRDKRTGKRILGNPFQRFLHGYSREKLERYNFLNTNAVMHRTSLVEQIGYWNPKTFFDDYDYWLRLSKVTDFAYLNQALVITYIQEEPFFQRLWRKGRQILRHGRRMPRPYDGDYEENDE